MKSLRFLLVLTACVTPLVLSEVTRSARMTDKQKRMMTRMAGEACQEGCASTDQGCCDQTRCDQEEKEERCKSCGCCKPSGCCKSEDGTECTTAEAMDRDDACKCGCHHPKPNQGMEERALDLAIEAMKEEDSPEAREVQRTLSSLKCALEMKRSMEEVEGEALEAAEDSGDTKCPCNNKPRPKPAPKKDAADYQDDAGAECQTADCRD